MAHEHPRTIEVRVAELKQLFHSIDPSPFLERDLDPAAEEFIVSRSREQPRNARLTLVVHLDRCAGLPNEAAMLQDAIRAFFTHRGDATRRRLRQLFRVGRTSLIIGLAFLAASIGVGNLVADTLSNSGWGEIFQESLLIGGWVAMWRPLEIFLYDWWPIRAEARLFDRLAAMQVRIEHATGVSSEAWRSDWPAVSPARQPEPP